MAIPSPTRLALAPLAWLYGAAIGYRNRYYGRACAGETGTAVRCAVVPVISVGNLTAGGTGKTPFVIEVVRRLRGLGRRPAILTRGYKARAGQPADEVLEFGLACPDVPLVVNPDRVAGATAAVRGHGADCLVLDDGFQHRRLHRDLDIVLIDALDPWGGGWMLPVGRLREPLGSLRRAGLIVITRTNQADAQDVVDILATLARRAPGTPILKAAVEPVQLADGTGGTRSPADLAERHVLAVCGVGNPQTFARSLEDLGAQLGPPLVFHDHQRYRAADARAIVAAAQRAHAEWVVTTRKDWVKLHALWPQAEAGGAEVGGEEPRGAVPLYRLDAGLALADPRGEFDARLRRLFS